MRDEHSSTSVEVSVPRTFSGTPEEIPPVSRGRGVSLEVQGKTFQNFSFHGARCFTEQEPPFYHPLPSLSLRRSRHSFLLKNIRLRDQKKLLNITFSKPWPLIFPLHTPLFWCHAFPPDFLEAHYKKPMQACFFLDSWGRSKKRELTTAGTTRPHY